MRIDVFNPKHEQTTAIFSLVSFKYKRCWRGAGDFTLELNSFDEADNLQNGYYLMINDEAYIVENRHKYDDGGKPKLELTGQHINSLLDRRVITQFDVNTTDTIEQQLYKLIRDNFISPSDSSRIMPGMTLAPAKGIAQKAASAYSLKNIDVLSALNQICGNYGLGWRVNYLPEQGQFVFEMLQGRDLTDQVFFSDSYQNIADSEIYENTQGYRNVLYTVSDEAGVKVYGQGSGIDRREMIAENVDPADAAEKLADNAIQISAEGMILDTEQFAYRDDWDLGDTVNYTDNSLGFSVNKPILEIEETCTTDTVIDVTFGDRIPTIFEILMKKVK